MQFKKTLRALKNESKTKTKTLKSNLNTRLKTKQKSKKIPEFPYYNKFYKININRIKLLAKNRKQNIIISDNEPDKKNYKFMDKFIPFKGINKYIIIKTDRWQDNFELNYLTNYFSEECRLKCQFANFIKPIDYWYKNYEKIINYLNKRNMEINNFNVMVKYLTEKSFKMFCNNFRIDLCLNILDIFKPKSWLDISAGWGDRLLGAIFSPHVQEYCGVDPNPCVQKAYKKILNVFNKEKKKKITLIQDGFETAKLPNKKFDIVFSSPPFFTLEKYSDAPQDSITQFKTMDDWFNNFLIPSIKKSIEHLNIGGHLVLYINESHSKEKYIPRMIEETDKLAKNIGMIYYANYNNTIRTIFCWQKV